MKLDEKIGVAGEGMFGSLKNLTSTLIALVYTRLDLLSTDMEEGRERLISMLIVTFLSLFCLCLGVVLLVILVIVIFWDDYRLLALTMLSGTFLLVGTILCVSAIRALRNMPRMFEASLAELLKDQQQINDHK